MIEIKTKIVLECLEDELKASSARGEKPRVITVNEIAKRIDYNATAKAYDYVYDITAEDFDTSEILKILDNCNAAYNYQGKIKNSKRLLFDKKYFQEV